jgi:tetratricopeptide (TPR) repeat protein
MAIEGSLQDVSLADICQLLAMGRKTGCLSVTDRSNFGYLYFENGRVIYASLLNRPDRLGELLVRNGVIEEEQLASAMSRQADGRSRSLVGEILLADGAITSEDLHRFIRVQIEEAVYHLFTWTRGSFHFDLDQRPEEEGLFLVDIPAESLLLEGARRVDEWSLIEKKIPSFDLVFEVVKDPAEDPDVELEPNQVRILPLIDAERTVQDVVSAAGMVEFDVGKALYGLIQAGFLERSGRRVTDGPEIDEQVRQHLNLGVAFYRSGMLEDATREFNAVVQKDPRNEGALHRLGLVAFRSRRYEDALRFFDRISGDDPAAFGVHRNRALTLEMLGRFDEALEALARCEALRPGDGEVALSRGVLLMQAGAPVEALADLQTYRADPAIKLPSPLFFATGVLAAAMAGNLDQSVALGREGLGLYPESGPILVNTAAALEQRGDDQTAEALYARAVALTPPPAQAHKALGDQAYAKGDLDQARIHYEKAVKVDPRLGDDVYLRLGTLAHGDADTDVARLLWRRALDLNPTNEAVRAHLELLDHGM